jgi:hypothetical protein
MAWSAGCARAGSPASVGSRTISAATESILMRPTRSCSVRSVGGTPSRPNGLPGGASRATGRSASEDGCRTRGC